MAKVMISFPDELLARFDSHARASGKTRSGLLQELAAAELSEKQLELKALIEASLANPIPRGGNSAELIRRFRDSR
ncbi:MAG: hypothetical protein ACRDKI_11330 [Solirubrobacterales bacterium]